MHSGTATNLGGGREALQAGGTAEAACWGLIAALETRLPARPCNVFYHQYKGTLTCVGPAAVCGKKSERKNQYMDFTPWQNPQQLVQIFPRGFYSADPQRVNIPLTSRRQT